MFVKLILKKAFKKNSTAKNATILPHILVASDGVEALSFFDERTIEDTENFQAIDEIFRLMHSMKGSGGMFGFDLLSDVTHDLDSLYEIFRTKKSP